MKCGSRASFLACTFANLYFGHEPKVKVTIEWKCDQEEFEPIIRMNVQIEKLLLVKKKHGM